MTYLIPSYATHAKNKQRAATAFGYLRQMSFLEHCAVLHRDCSSKHTPANTNTGTLTLIDQVESSGAGLAFGGETDQDLVGGC